MHSEGRFKKILKYIIMLIFVALLVVGSGSMGYNLARRYKSTITNTYNDFVNNITSKIDNIGDDILDDMSEVSEK
ncbi:MAG: hypothetical protein PUG48_03585 [Clostridia bacterium]|nr:hypothetical protein [Clostridia bacterium]